MAQKKENEESTENKPEVKVQDLAPKKDAKGGAARSENSMNPSGANLDANRVETNSVNLD